MKTNNVLIIGDSYSTFEGYIPDGYECFYMEGGREDNDVISVCETWWHQVIDEMGASLVLNNSWSGSTVGYTGYCGSDCSKTNSFICRLEQLSEKGFFRENPVDTVFVFGGTNDDWSEAPLGEIKLEGWEIDDLYCVLPAICFLVKRLVEILPDAKIYCLVNTELKREIGEAFQKACDAFGATAITFDHIEKNVGHPTVQGMIDIKNQVLKAVGRSSRQFAI